jgi:hypothetical protein
MKRAAAIFLVLSASGLALGHDEPPPVLATVKRVFVEQLGGGQTSDQMRDMIIAAIQSSNLFVITENQTRADAIIKGSADDKTFTEQHNTNDSIGVHTDVSSGDSSGNYIAGNRASHQSAGVGITDTESSHIQERRHEAQASIRMVDTDGDVIWSTTQESNGGKFRGAMADVADKIMRQLTVDVRKARVGSSVTKPVVPQTQNARPQ